VKDAIESYTPENNRSQILEKNGHRIILDAYNANPTSMKAALENFRNIEGQNKIVFLGDMFELGETASAEHQNIADLASRLGFANVYLIGALFNEVNTSLKRFKSFQEISEYLQNHPLKDRSNLLIKGSRGMALERVVSLL